MISPADKEFWKARALPASLLGLTFLSWVGIYNLSFISDDFPLLAEQFIKPFTLFTPTAYFIAPVFKLFLSIGTILFGTAAIGYYAIIVIIHLSNVFLFFKLLQKFGFDEKVALVSALAWGTLAQYAEALFWISGSVHVFTLFFVLFSAYTAIRWEESNKIYFLVISILLLVSGFLCRESAVLFLFIWAMYVVIRKYKIKEIILKFLPFIVIIGMLIIVMQLLRSFAGLEPQKYMN
ncbi:MAG: glycosyltransferase family 39 protein, partial [Acidobacteria bacterium]|nr:glycosyltransferase family 39 protein [Acidobacteriota bacterium]